MAINPIRLMLACAILFLPACTSRNSEFRLAEADSLQLSEELLPAGWTSISIPPRRVNDWRTLNAFDTELNKFTGSELHVSTYDFLLYETTSEAHDAYSQFESRVFYGGVSSDYVWLDMDIGQDAVQNADAYLLRCRDESQNINRCTYWAMYERCILYLQAPLSDDAMPVQNFISLIHELDTRIITYEFCDHASQ